MSTFTTKPGTVSTALQFGQAVVAEWASSPSLAGAIDEDNHVNALILEMESDRHT